jgi:histidyl-tRNA synthetase
MKNKKTKEEKTIDIENLDKIGEISYYYGFTPIKTSTLDKCDANVLKQLTEKDEMYDSQSKITLPLFVENKISVIRSYEKQNLGSQPQPVMLYIKDPMKGSRKSNPPLYSEFHILGSSGSIAEATMIQAGLATLAKIGYKNLSVEINSMGDKESLSKFIRELNSVYRKNINDISADDRQLLKSDPFDLLLSGSKTSEKVNANAPRFIDYLNEGNRKHLEELLEYMETLEIPYNINNQLVGSRLHPTETIFAIVENDENLEKKTPRILAIGMRHSGIGKMMGLKRDVPGVSMFILSHIENQSLKKDLKKVKKPIASFVQLGIESKLLSLKVIEKLRQVDIPLKVSLAKDRLGAQVSSVEKYHTPYTLIMGKREAQDKAVIVRHQETYSQEIVLIDEIADYMVKIEKKLK